MSLITSSNYGGLSLRWPCMIITWDIWYLPHLLLTALKKLVIHSSCSNCILLLHHVLILASSCCPAVPAMSRAHCHFTRDGFLPSSKNFCFHILFLFDALLYIPFIDHVCQISKIVLVCLCVWMYVCVCVCMHACVRALVKKSQGLFYFLILFYCYHIYLPWNNRKLLY